MKTGEKYPKDFPEFLEQFKDEEACRKYLFEVRWPSGFHCPQCDSEVKNWVTAKNLIHCGICGHQTSLTSGTLFHGTRKPLLFWFRVIWWIVAQKTGVSASNMTDFMGFGSYKTAWAWLQKIRMEMERTFSEKLSGMVEVDEFFLGGSENDTKGNGREVEKKLVAVATECIGRKIGRVRFRCIDAVTAENLIPFIQDNVLQGSKIITNDRVGYDFLNLKSKDLDSVYTLEVKTLLANNNKSRALLPHVRLVYSLLQRWLFGTHQGRVSTKYLPYYLHEFAFRFNRKLLTCNGELFYKLIQKSIEIVPVSKIDTDGKST